MICALHLVAPHVQIPTASFREWNPAKKEVRRLGILLVRFGGAPSVVAFPRERYRNMMAPTWPGLGHYWRSVSYGALRIIPEVVDWTDLPGSSDAFRLSPGANLDAQRLADAVARRVDLSVFDQVAFVTNRAEPVGFPYTTSIRVGGRSVPASVIAQFLNRQQVFAHETGHGLGLDHSSGPFADAYDSPWDVMSTEGTWGQRTVEFDAIGGETNAYHKIVKGWIPKTRIVELRSGETRTFRLERLAEPTSDTVALVAVVRDSSSPRFWTLEARLGAGYDANAIPSEGIVVHECDPRRTDRASQALQVGTIKGPKKVGTSFSVGETVSVPSKFEAHVDGRDGSGFTLTVKVAD